MMNKLRDKSLAFAKRIGGTWTDIGGVDCKAYQRRFLYIHAFGAYHTAKSYWILHESKCYSDCNVLARNLLERIVNSICGAKSPTHAVELIAFELSEKIRHVKLWSPAPHLSAQLSQTIKDNEKILPIFLRLIKKSKAPNWNYHKRFCEADLPGFYRSTYFNFSRYAHAEYEMPCPGKHNQQSKAADFMALVAPVLTAANCHAADCLDCVQGKCSVRAESMALLQAF